MASSAIGVVLLVLGTVCIEPSPLYIRDTSIRFDIGRNVLLSLFPFIRLMGLMFIVAGLGSTGRSRLTSMADRALTRLASLTMKRSITLLAGVGIALGVVFSLMGYGRVPSIRDEIAALFQADIFMSGRVVAEPPAYHEFMDMSPILTDPSWSSMYPPVWSVMLALGGFFNIQWLLNPLLSGAIAVALFLLLRRHHDTSTAWIAVILLFTSPFFLRLSGSYMSHHLTLLMFLVAYLLIFTHGRRSVFSGAIAGIALACALGTRPWAAACLGLPLAVICLREIVQSERRPFWMACILGFIVSVIPLFFYNEISTGSWLKTGYLARLGPKGSMGFGEKAMGLHSPLLGFLHNAGRLYRLNVDLLGVPIPGLWVVVLGLVCGAMNATVWYLFIGFLLIWFGSGLYWWYEHWFGPRYLFEGIPVLLWLAAMGIQTTRRGHVFKPYVMSAFIIGACWAILSVIPRELYELSGGYGEVDRITVRDLRDPVLSGTAVIVQDSDDNAWPHDTYTSAFLAMVLDDFTGAVILRDLDERNAVLDTLLPQKNWHYYCHGDEYGIGTVVPIDGPEKSGDIVCPNR